MKKAMVMVVALAFAVAAGVFASGQSEGSKPVVNLTFFTGKAETVDWMNGVIAKFNAENTGIRVTQEYQKDASNAIKVKFASGDVPDITATQVPQEFMDQGLYMDLSNEPFWSRILPSVKELCTDIKSGKQYKVATDVTTAGIFYNKKIFSDLNLKPAYTWQGFVQNLETIKQQKPGVVPFFLGGKDSWTLGHLIEFLAHGIIKQEYGINGSRKAFIYNNENELQFASATGPMAIFASRMLELQQKGLINSDAVTATYGNQKNAFADGKAAVISQGMWVLGDLLKINPDVKNWLGFSAFPAIKDGTKPVTLSAEDSTYALPSASKHHAEALTFLSFLFSPANQKSYSELLKEPSAFTDVNADWGPIKDQVAEALKVGVNIPFTPWPSGFSGDDAGRMVQELLIGQYKTPVAFARAFAAAWNKAWNSAHN
jgi:raffinose/stachyose/melibiose transport system substrate-binding protein